MITLFLLITAVLVNGCAQATPDAERESMATKEIMLPPEPEITITDQVTDQPSRGVGADIEEGPTLAWKAAVGDGLAAPAMIASGQVIVASHQAIFAFDADTGKETWRVTPDGGVWSKSLAVGDGRVIAGVPGGLLALNAADGREMWFAPTTGEVLWSPLVDEAVYAPSAFVGPGVDPDPEGQAWIYAFDPDNGAELWSAETQAYALTTPTTGAGTLFVGGSRIDKSDVQEGGHMRIHAFSQDDGSSLWTADRTDGFLKSLASDGQRLYYLAYTDMVYALDAKNGEELWRYPTENWSPGLTENDGTLYFGSDNAFVHAVTGEDGQPIWRTPLEGTFNGPRGRPAVDQDTVYFQGNDNRLYALDRQSGEILWVTIPQVRSRAAVAVADGQLFLSGQNGVLYAFR